MKEYVNQIYNEGLGANLYVPLRNVINTKIDSKAIKKVFISIINVVYFIIAIAVSIFLFLITYPL